MNDVDNDEITTTITNDAEARRILQQCLMDVVFDDAVPSSPQNQERIQLLAQSSKYSHLFHEDFQFELGHNLVEKPIHILCFVYTQVTFETFQAVIRAAGDGSLMLKTPSNSIDRGNLPIHRILDHHNNNSVLVETLCKACPETIHMTNHQMGQTPFHHCCQQLADFSSFHPFRHNHTMNNDNHLFKSIINKALYLLSVCPSTTLLMSDKKKRLPLHTLLYGLPNNNASSLENRTNHLLKIILEVLEVAPSAASVFIPDVPLNLALAGGFFAGDDQQDLHETLVSNLLRYCPKASDDVKIVERAFQQSSNSWNVRIQVLSYHLSRRHQGGGGVREDSDTTTEQQQQHRRQYVQKFPLHSILQYQLLEIESGSSHIMILSKDCIRHFSTELLHMDDIYGRFPLHWAMMILSLQQQKATTTTSDEETTTVLLSCILEMIHLEPRIASIRDAQTGLYPFMMTAASAYFEEEEQEQQEHLANEMNHGNDRMIIMNIKIQQQQSLLLSTSWLELIYKSLHSMDVSTVCPKR